MLVLVIGHVRHTKLAISLVTFLFIIVFFWFDNCLVLFQPKRRRKRQRKRSPTQRTKTWDSDCLTKTSCYDRIHFCC